jgi:hypothetical protein
MIDQDQVRAKVIRPNIECSNGYIHLVDTVMLDDAAPWTVGGTVVKKPHGIIILTTIIMTSVLYNYVFSVTN